MLHYVLIQGVILKLLEEIGLAELANDYPSNLSGGEMRRVSIVRAMMNDPKIILADEPTGNLDPKTSTVVFEELVSLVKETGLSALIATHNFELADQMDRKITLKDGHLQDARVSVSAIERDNFY